MTVPLSQAADRLAAFLPLGLGRWIPREGPLMVYTMRKVGSSTMAASLRKGLSPRGIKVHKCHYLSRYVHEGIQSAFRAMGRPVPKYVAKDGQTREFLSNWCRHSRPYWGMSKCRVITLVRDPIATLVSDFFHSMQVTSPELFEQESDNGAAVGEIRESFQAQVDKQLSYHGSSEDDPQTLLYRLLWDIPLHWFDWELKGVLGVDVLRSGFFQERGCGLCRGRHADVLVIRFEDLNKCGVEAVRRFLGVDLGSLSKANLSSEKPFYDWYRRFRDSVRLPGRFVDRYYLSRQVRYFYSDTEVADFRSRWQR